MASRGGGGVPGNIPKVFADTLADDDYWKKLEPRDRNKGGQGGGQDTNNNSNTNNNNPSSSNNPGGGNGSTKPSLAPDPNNRPGGKRTPDDKGSAEKKRSLVRENESADAMARAGYKVEQNPDAKDNKKEPDYKIEDEYFDCYAPTGDRPNKIRNNISDKVKKGQADHIVLNLDDTNLNPDDLKKYMQKNPIGNLKDIKIVQNGQVTEFFPFS